MVDADGDDLGIFFTDSRDAASQCEAEVLKDFCRGMSLGDVESGIGSGGHRRAVWLDDRGSRPDLEGSDTTRQYENPLTATGLTQVLKRLRFNHEDLPDAARRLIYITDSGPCLHSCSCSNGILSSNPSAEKCYIQTSYISNLNRGQNPFRVGVNKDPRQAEEA
jgi:hypothetical protein